MREAKLNKTYIIFLDLPSKIASRIDYVKEKYSSNKKWRAHFTLKYEEELSSNIEKQLIKDLFVFTKYQKPIELKIGNVEICKQNFGWNIYLKIENPEIYKIIGTLSSLDIFKTKKNKWELSKKYYPHISIKGGTTLTDLKRFHKLINKENLNFPKPVLCTSMTLACWNKDRWEKVKTFKLRGLKEPVSMSWGYPDLKDFPKDDFATTCRYLSNKNTEEYLQYDPSIGLEKLRKLITAEGMLGCNLKDYQNLLLTPGGTFAIFLSSYFFKNILGFNSIGVYMPCYDTALEIFKILKFEIIDLNTISNKGKKPDCLYLNPRFNNPTGLSVNESIINQIQSYLRNGVCAIEDDVYHIFNYSKNKNYTTFKDKYPNNVFYIDSFSKILAPGLRLGCLVPPVAFMEQTAYLQKYICSSPSTLSQNITYELLKNKKYKTLTKKLCTIYSKKMDKLEKALAKNGLEQYSKKVEGGFYKWLEIPCPLSDNLKKALLKKNVNIVDGKKYFIVSGKRYFIRLSIANIDIEKIDYSIETIKKIIYEKTSNRQN